MIYVTLYVVTHAILYVSIVGIIMYLRNKDLRK